MKLTFARLSQQLAGLEVEFLGADGLRYSDWLFVRPDHVAFTGRDVFVASISQGRQGRPDRSRNPWATPCTECGLADPPL
jgi:hypothetical protein